MLKKTGDGSAQRDCEHRWRLLVLVAAALLGRVLELGMGAVQLDFGRQLRLVVAAKFPRLADLCFELLVGIGCT